MMAFILNSRCIISPYTFFRHKLLKLPKVVPNHHKPMNSQKLCMQQIKTVHFIHRLCYAISVF